jgi:uncharacterized protein involved in exopolysaccharide biosynthesis
MYPENEALGNLRDVLNVLFKHKAKMITIFLTIVITVTAGTFLMSPVYEASSKVLVKFGRENIYIPTNPAAGGNQPILFDSSREERINSEIEIFKGRNLIERTISELGITSIYPDIDRESLIPRPWSKKLSPLEKATLAFEKKLTVEGVRKSEVIEIRFQHNDPVIASQAVNKMTDAFLEHHLSVFKQSQHYSFFDEQVTLLEKKLKDSENELEDVRRQHNISSLQEQKTLLLKQISELEVDLAKTRGEISENEGKMEALRGATSEALKELTMGTETELNPYAISSIRSRLSELKMKEEELLAKYNEQSIMVANVRKEIEKARSLLAREEKNYHDKAVNSISHTLNALRSKEDSQKQHLDQYQQELNSINTIELRLKELEREVRLNEENYQLYIKNMEEARISNAMDNQKIANISVIEPAQPPIKPIKPKKLLNMILSVLLGGFAALGVAFSSEYLSHTFNNSAEVKSKLGVSVLATIPEMRGN